MITREVNDWIKNIESGMYSDVDIMFAFQNFAKYLTREELIQIKNRLQGYLNS